MGKSLEKYRQALNDEQYNILLNPNGVRLILASPGCLQKDSVIRFSRAKKGFRLTIEDAYKHFHGKSENISHNWDRNIETYVRSFIEEQNRIKLNKIIDIVYSGKKRIFKLILSNNSVLYATEDHGILTKIRWKKLGDLLQTDEVMIDTIKRHKSVKKIVKREKQRDKERYVGNYYPYGRRHKKNGWRTATHRLIFEANLNNMELEDFIRASYNKDKARLLKCIDPSIYHIHHINGNHYDNRLENLQLIERKEHYILHANKDNSCDHFNHGIPEYSKVISVEDTGKLEDTYDIMCESPNNNFVANDMVVHNSGKTRQMTHQGAYNIEMLNANPERMLMLTFTVKAGSQMRERVTKLIGISAAKSLTVTNFHKYCVKMLRLHFNKLGREKDFEIIDSNESRNLFDTAKATILGSTATDKKHKYINYDAYSKKRLFMEKFNVVDYDRIGEEYENLKLKDNLVDFDDLEILFHRLVFTTDFGKFISKRYDYIYVDEVQDTNRFEFEIIQKLGEKCKNISVYGDIDQSIYMFRGAYVQNIIEFKKNYPDAKIFYMNNNYRSTPEIANCGNVTASFAEKREFDKKIVAIKGSINSKPAYVVANDEDSQAGFISQLVEYLIKGKKINPNEIFIIYRNNYMSASIEQNLIEKRIPYKIYGGFSFLDRKHIKDAICFLKIMANFKSSDGWSRLLKYIPLVGDATVKKIVSYIRENKTTDLSDMPSVKKEVVYLGQAITNCLGKKPRVSFKRFMPFLLEIVKGYCTKNDYEDRKQDLYNFYEKIKGYKSNRKALDTIMTAFEQDEEEENCVKLMTIHKCKGLESDVIIMPNVASEMLPFYRATTRKDLEEERRLFYVGETRARKHLIFLRPGSVMKFGKMESTSTSLFITELLRSGAINPYNLNALKDKSFSFIGL